MKVMALAALLAVLPGWAAAADLSGSGALALAALVGQQSPTVSVCNRTILGHLLDGRVDGRSKGAITVAADEVTCRSSNVDISEHDCTLTFGGKTRMLKGRAAHELFATLIENGVKPDGAAGSNFESVKHLACTVDPAALKNRDGSGASCKTN